MLLYIIVFFFIFFICFFIFLFLLIYKEIIIGYVYLIIPAICIGLWAILALLEENGSTPITYDFKVFYYAGTQFLTNPSKLYDIEGYLYLPVFAMFFAVTFSLLPLELAAWSFFVMSYLFAILTIIEYDKILILFELNKKSHRFFFLLIISNGILIFYQFRFNQSKYLLFFILIYILRREIQYRKESSLKNLKYNIINYGLFVFAISIAPYFIFLLVIYFFQDIIKFNQLVEMQNLNKILMIFLLFIIQNFIFLIYPYQVIQFLDGITHPIKRKNEKLKIIYLREFLDVSSRVMFYLIILSISVLSLTTIILIYKNKLKIEEKFAYFAITYILIGVFAYTHLLCLILFSLILLAFAPFMDKTKKGVEFIKSNYYFLLGLFSFIGLFFVWPEFFIFGSLSDIEKNPIYIVYYSRWIILLGCMIGCFIILKLKNNNNRN